jgi:hypothetical protein
MTEAFLPLASIVVVVGLSSLALLIQLGILPRSKLAIARVGQKPGILGNNSNGHFFSHSLQVIEQGYAHVSSSFKISSWDTRANNYTVQGLFVFIMDNRYGSSHCVS